MMLRKILVTTVVSVVVWGAIMLVIAKPVFVVSGHDLEQKRAHFGQFGAQILGRFGLRPVILFVL